MFRIRFFPASSVTIAHPPEKPASTDDLFVERLVFVWDKLIDPTVVEELFGRPLAFAPAVLPGFARHSRREGSDWAFDLIEEAESSVLGAVLIGVEEAELDLLDDYQQVPIHRIRHKAKVRIGDLERVVDVYLRSGAYLDE